MESSAVTFARIRFGVMVCVALCCCSQAMAGARAFVSSETDVTGGIVVKNDGSSLTIKEKGTGVLKRLFFIPQGVFLEAPETPETRDSQYPHGTDFAKLTSVVVDNHIRTKDKIKAGMRAQIVYYIKTRTPDGHADTTIFMQSVRAISNGEPQ